MALFAIADLHLSLGSDKPMDVFPGWENYIGRIEKNWRAVVSERDTVVIAGDISWAMKLEDSEKDMAFLEALPGRKLLIKGNHDYWWSTRKKIEAFLASRGFGSIGLVFNSSVSVEGIAVCGTRGWLYGAESDEDKKIVNREAGRLNASIDAAASAGGKPVVFLHYPPVYDGTECPEMMDVLISRGITDCYFGHVHGSAAARRTPYGEYRGVRMHLVACDFLGFRPVPVIVNK